MELDRFRALVVSRDWDGIEAARPDVRTEHLPALVELYREVDGWLERVALVQLVQDHRDPVVRPIMVDVLNAPEDRETDLVELTKAAALGHLDERYDTFERFYADRDALHAAVDEVLRRELRQLAESGRSEAMNALGTLCMRDERVDEAEEWYRRAADAGDRSAMYNLGLLLCRNRRDDPGAEYWWGRAGEAGHVRAMAGLADLLVSRDDPAAAEPWYRRAAAAGDADAMFGLAVLCADHGDIAEAISWYERAAGAGDDRAMYNLAVHYEQAGDPDAARRWWRQAAAAGNPRAMRHPGL